MEISLASIPDLSMGGLLVLTWAYVLVAIVRGWLVPRSTHETWVEAYKTERAARIENDQAVSDLVENARLTVELLESVRREARAEKAGGG